MLRIIPFLAHVLSLVLLLLVFSVQLVLAQSNSTVKLEPFTFTPLPLGSIKPAGWLRDQMQLMADGLAGHEMDFFPIVQDNRWLGGSTDYSDLNEGLPYWFNGLVGLAYSLDDQRLVKQVLNVSSYVLGHQNKTTGWLGPETTYDSNNLWGRFPMSLGLKQLAEANASMTDDIVSALYKFIPLMDKMLTDGKSNTEVWGRARYADMNIVIQWLYESHPNDNTSQLIETMARWQAHGVDWAGYYTQANYLFNDINTYPDNKTDADFPFLHGVNVAQGLKTMGVNYRFTSDQSLIQVSNNAVNWTFMYHGAPSGSILGDERETSLQPQHGSELCTTVETIYSMTYLYHLFGDPSLADRAELAAFNAMPAQLTPNYWAHQYIALPNQPFATRIPESAGLWWNTNQDAITFALEPDYPCCAVNHPQGWPKFLSATFALAGTSGLAHTLLAPATVNTTLEDGTAVSVACDTNYPFTNSLAYTVSASSPFTFYVRVPTWTQAANPTITLNGATIDTSAGPDAHGMLAVPIPSGDSSLTYTLAPAIRVEHRGNNSVSIHRGALLYALDLGQTNTTVPPADTSTPVEASTVYYNNTQPWNLALNVSTLQYHGPDGGDNAALPHVLFEYQGPPNYITVEACAIKWDLFHGVPGPVPLDGSRNCTGKVMNVTMRPYGSLRARMVELPVMGT